MPLIADRVNIRRQVTNFSNILLGRELRRDIRGFLSRHLPSLRFTQAATAGAANPLATHIMMMAANGGTQTPSPVRVLSRPPVTGPSKPPSTPPPAPNPPAKQGNTLQKIAKAAPYLGWYGTLSATSLILGFRSLATNITLNVLPTAWTVEMGLVAKFVLTAGFHIAAALIVAVPLHLIARRIFNKPSATSQEAPVKPANGGNAQPPVLDSTEILNIRASLERIRTRTVDENANELENLATAHEQLRTLLGYAKQLDRMPGDVQQEVRNLLSERSDQIREMSEQAGLYVADAFTVNSKSKTYFLLPVTEEVSDRITTKVGTGMNRPLLPNAHWLGSGAMGEVYEAIDAATGQRVALKVLRDLSFTDRFKSEFETQAKVNHGSVVKVFARGVCTAPDGVEYPLLTMEHMAWPDLDAVIKDGVFQAEEAARVGYAIASVLHHLHQLGITHRDLKPANIFYDRSTGEIKVADFGLAKDVDGQAEATATGIWAGTPAYGGPFYLTDYSAQKRGNKDLEVLKRNDLYANAVIIYKMLTGYTQVWDLGDGLHYIGESPINDKATGKPVINAMPMRRMIDAFVLFRQALNDGNMTRANEIRSQWALVHDFKSLRGVKARTQIEDDLFTIILNGVTWNLKEGYSDAHALMTVLDRFNQGLPLRPEEEATRKTARSEPVRPSEPTMEVGSGEIEVVADSPSLDALLPSSEGPSLAGILQLIKEGATNNKLATMESIITGELDVFSLSPADIARLNTELMMQLITARGAKETELAEYIQTTMSYLMDNVSS
ncbi:MAG: serine/threonine-protein kinase [Candidatus Margulisiibacteriota bacterium]